MGWVAPRMAMVVPASLPVLQGKDKPLILAQSRKGAGKVNGRDAFKRPYGTRA
jgi:hypothetical protein